MAIQPTSSMVLKSLNDKSSHESVLAGSTKILSIVLLKSSQLESMLLFTFNAADSDGTMLRDTSEPSSPISSSKF